MSQSIDEDDEHTPEHKLRIDGGGERNSKLSAKKGIPLTGQISHRMAREERLRCL